MLDFNDPSLKLKVVCFCHKKASVEDVLQKKELVLDKIHRARNLLRKYKKHKRTNSQDFNPNINL